MITRRKSKKIFIGGLTMGGDAPIRVQSMTNTNTIDIKKTVNQIKRLEKLGCEIVRVAVPNLKTARALGEIKRKINLPLVADIHFSADLALESIKQGIDKLRINPGNIGNEEKIKKMVKECKKRKIPIRIGVNAGSLDKDILRKYNNKATSQGMVDSALKHIEILEKLGFFEITVSLKASDIERTIEAYRILSQKVSYPLHLGITEAGTKFRGTIMSAIGIGILLHEGIGDTIRVSLTDKPEEEIPVAYEILSCLNLRKRRPTITSCPTCGRTEINLVKLTKEVEKIAQKMEGDIHIAVMGCVVNGPGEAREADLAVIGGKGVGLLCCKGKIVKKVLEKKLLSEFKKMLEKKLIIINN